MERTYIKESFNIRLEAEIFRRTSMCIVKFIVGNSFLSGLQQSIGFIPRTFICFCRSISPYFECYILFEGRELDWRNFGKCILHTKFCFPSRFGIHIFGRSLVINSDHRFNFDFSRWLLVVQIISIRRKFS